MRTMTIASAGNRAAARQGALIEIPADMAQCLRELYVARPDQLYAQNLLEAYREIDEQTEALKKGEEGAKGQVVSGLFGLLVAIGGC